MTLLRSIAVASCLLLNFAASGTLLAVPFDLADVLGGGDGTGTGSPNTGYDPRTGTPVAGFVSVNNPGVANVFNPIGANPLIDGVFVPTAPGPTPVNSNGDTASLPGTTNQAWGNMISSNAGAIAPSSQTVGGVPVDFTSAPNSWIYAHANGGITFDLNAFEAASPGFQADQLDIVVGALSAGTVDFFALLDSNIVASQTGITSAGPAGPDTAYTLSIPIAPDDRFLTLVSGAAGTYSSDSFFFGNPILNLSPVPLTPEPTSLAMWVAISSVFVTWCIYRRRRSRLNKVLP